jgi:plasmid replication initiation protein
MKIYVGEMSEKIAKKKKKSVDVAVLIYCDVLSLPYCPSAFISMKEEIFSLTHTNESNADSQMLGAVAHMPKKHWQQIFHREAHRVRENFAVASSSCVHELSRSYTTSLFFSVVLGRIS